MPLVRIDLSSTLASDIVTSISHIVYDVMIKVANVPENDKFQIVTRHSPDELIYPAEGYLGISYSPKIVFIQVTWNAGRTIAVKKAFYKAIAEQIHAATGISTEDVWISLIDVKREDWSFGNGEMQYGPVD